MATRYFLSFLVLVTMLGVGRVATHLWMVTRPSPVTEAINSSLEPRNAEAIETTTTARASGVTQPEKKAATSTSSMAGECATVGREEREELQRLRLLKSRRQSEMTALEALQKNASAAEKRAREQVAVLQALAERIQTSLAKEQSINDKKIKRLAAVYEGMKANKSAPIIAKMELSTVVRMMARMDEKKVGKILSNLSPNLAVRITEALTRKLSLL